jgi:glycosyltransferase involved in cell wall biosynthesis
VARFEPENHVEEIVAGYRRSAASRPLVVVGSAPYADEYTAAVHAAAGGDPRIRLVGGVWDQRLLDQLYAGALTYLHGHSVGGTNPSLLRAMGAGTATLGWDVSFNREVLGESGRFFGSAAELAPLLEAAEADPADVASRAAQALVEAARYDWDEVAKRYEQLCERLAAGWSLRGQASGRRRAGA